MSPSNELIIKTGIFIEDFKHLLFETTNEQEDAMARCRKLVKLCIESDKQNEDLALSLLDSTQKTLQYFGGFGLEYALSHSRLTGPDKWITLVNKWLTHSDDLLVYLALQTLKMGCRLHENVYYYVLSDNTLLRNIITLTEGKQSRIKQAAVNLIVELSEYECGSNLFAELNGGLIAYRLLLSEHPFVRIGAIKLLEIMSWHDNIIDELTGTSVEPLVLSQLGLDSEQYSIYAIVVLANFSERKHFRETIIDSE
jgi:hypothetical protein